MRTVPTGEQTKKSAETSHVLAEVERNIKTAVEDKFILLINLFFQKFGKKRGDYIWQRQQKKNKILYSCRPD